MKTLLLMISLLFSACLLSAQDAIQLVPFSSGYTAPVDIANCGDSRLFIVQRTGQIFISNAAGTKSKKPFLDISDRVTSSGGEQGLLGLAFDPDYTTNGFFFVNYIDKNGNTQISRFKRNPNNANRANQGSEKSILKVAQPYTNHNGGCLKFGPDGYLYIGLGDGGDAGDPGNRAQNPAVLLGKMLRIDVHNGSPYSIPADNPFKNVAGYSPEIWDLGLRNPWRFSFDASNGALIIADVGQGLWEEVDREKPGSKGGFNYGWRCYEGNHDYNTGGCSAKTTYTFPVYEYQHLNNDCSIIGGFVYRGQLNPQAYGKYIYTDYCSGRFHALTFGNKVKETLLLAGSQYVYNSFGEDVSGELYVCSNDGTVYKLVPANNAQSAKAIVTNKPQVHIYPNPSKGKFLLEYKANSGMNYTLRISNQIGTPVYAGEKYLQAGNNRWDVNIGSQVKGTYMVTLANKNGIISTQQLLIE